ncbi:hypothetical protein [Flavilitoribacter nigricans]|uniref:Uncharacterized protein n=1 Tax=Flavilitoribacter nigricans (strain ATCC 23147 / DSM 23189 / NBRC 102662 / NCIMB 1420 / SS-2) TaxID=1122177 RepID=A0A2D0MZZ2_FLAN2|nr:hypothetical protein [Flavilitoribacter nigricans]PHN01787.1 hypothetical protein CRP01_35465 [Flavilitoribacter nigricans DSM 23189 = NBRC 102662]
MSSFLKFSAFLLITFTITLSTACSKDNPGPGGCAANFNWTVELQDEANVLSNAAQAYAQDPTTENCNTYKDAYQDYLDAAEDIDFCVPAADQAAYDAAIEDARDSLDDLQC